MRFVLTSAAALIFGGFVLAAGATSAPAAPLPSIAASLDAASIGVQQIDWRRRYYRRNGVWPPASVPPAIVEEDVIVVPDAPVVRIFPPRPASCGEFHYWDDERCLDARYHDPYVGRR